MKNTKLIFLLLPTLLQSGCGADIPPVPEETKTVHYSLEPSLRKKESTKTDKYELDFVYKDSLFSGDAKVFNKELAMLSYGSSMMTDSKDEIIRFYNELDFDQIESHYALEEGAHTMSYVIAHKKIENNDVIAVTVKGRGYLKEWADNFELGATGNHAGFNARALELYAELKTYLSKYESYKLWLTGYSRGGAIVNVLSHHILSKNELTISKENMYVYTFETPKGIDATNKVEYENVFNVVNGGDLVTYFAPEEQYGLSRCGKDIELYTSTSNIDALFTAFDSDIALPEFKHDEYSAYKNEIEFAKKMISTLTQEPTGTDNEYIYLNTRESFATNAQKPLQTALNLYLTLPKEEIDKIKDDAMRRFQEEGLSFISVLLGAEDGIYNYITPFLDEAHYEYDPTDFLADCKAIRNIIIPQLGVVYALIATDSEAGSDLSRSISLHYPESVYILLNAYNPVQE